MINLSDELVIVLGIVGVIFAITLIKELFSFLARKTIYGVGQMIKYTFAFTGWVIKMIFRVITAPFALLWAAVTNR